LIERLADGIFPMIKTHDGSSIITEIKKGHVIGMYGGVLLILEYQEACFASG